MPNLPTWEVKLSIFGPIKIRGTHELRIFKGFQVDDPFYSDISIKSTNFGVETSVTSFASKSSLAHKAAIFFLGQMLDSLALSTRQPLFLSFQDIRVNRFEEFSTRRIIEEHEWISSFKESRCLNEYEQTFLRALGWYRKGLYSEDPFDKFLALWNSIEVTASKYHTKNSQAKKGVKNQIWQCFVTLWGECKDWPIIAGDNKWIDNNYEIRKDIAHGLAPVTVKSIEKIIAQIETLEEVAHAFLSNWKSEQLPMDNHLSSLLAHIGKESQ